MEFNNDKKLMQYNNKDISVFRDQIVKRSQGDGEENVKNEKVLFEFQNLSVNNSNTSNCDKKNNVPVSICTELPSVLKIARKLKKVTFLEQDQFILNQPPKNLCQNNGSIIFLKKPFETKKTLSVAKHREPKFVPYEPYKCCIKAILNESSQKKKIQVKFSTESKPSLNVDKENKANDKVNLIIVDFEEEKKKWEFNNNELRNENQSLKRQIEELQKDHFNMQQQLLTQSQVNTELKKLLVASVGEDVQGRVQCLTEDKARMATMIRKYSEKVDKDYEEKEKVNIQCDVWRSKFLASSLLVDELARWKGVLLNHFCEAQDAIALLFSERDIIHRSLIESYKSLHSLQVSFDPLDSEGSCCGLLAGGDAVSLATGGATAAVSLQHRLLGALGRALPPIALNLPENCSTPGENMAAQVLQYEVDPECNLREGFVALPLRAGVVSRFHPLTRSHNITLNCCENCSGEIKVV